MTGPAASGASSVEAVLANLRAGVIAGVARPLAWRLEQLGAIRRLVDEQTPAILEALHQDLGKARDEGWVTDVAGVAGAVHELERRLPRFARGRRVRVPLAHRPGRARVVPEGRGISAVVAPWNYPVQLTLVPLATALAAGNCVVVKPSELAPATSALLAGTLARYVDPRACAVVEGDAATTLAIIAGGVDHVFFTGSETTGRAVLMAASEHLVPVTLELGGKSPAVLDESADVGLAARRIARGKFVNAGQSCVAPDYVLVPRSRADEFGHAIVESITAFFGTDPSASPDFGRIVNDRHFTRLEHLATGHGGRVLLDTGRERATRYFGPTVICDPDPEGPLGREEIFGPVLPVFTYDTMPDAARFVAGRPSPLALYVFCRDRSAPDVLAQATRSGSVCVNTTAEQFLIPGLPFGGVGASGSGVYHGIAGLETFSYPRTRFTRPTWPDPGVGYPPVTPTKRAVLRRLIGR